MNAIEKRYRCVLQLYPEPYRRTNGEEILSTLLATSPPEAKWPALHEISSLLLHACDVRYAAATGRKLAPTLLQSLELMCLLSLAALGTAFFEGLSQIASAATARSSQSAWMIADAFIGIFALTSSLLAARRGLACVAACAALAFVAVDATGIARTHFAHELALAPVLMSFCVARKTHYVSRGTAFVYLALGTLDALAAADVFLCAPLLTAATVVAAIISLLIASVDPRITCAFAMAFLWHVLLAAAIPTAPLNPAPMIYLAASTFAMLTVSWRSRARATI